MTGRNTYVIPYFRSAQAVITESAELDFEIAVMVGKIKENMSRYMREGSGWTFGHIELLEIHLNEFKSGQLLHTNHISTCQKEGDRQREE